MRIYNKNSDLEGHAFCFRAINKLATRKFTKNEKGAVCTVQEPAANKLKKLQNADTVIWEVA